MAGPFELLEFEDADVPSMAYEEYPGQDIVLREILSETAVYEKMFAEAEAVALDEQQTNRLIDSIVEAYQRGFS
jgi:hypothetical protein